MNKITIYLHLAKAKICMGIILVTFVLLKISLKLLIALAATYQPFYYVVGR